MATTAGRFIPNAAAVARPVAVFPPTRHEGVQQKWSRHAALRGLNRGTCPRVTASYAVKRAPFQREQVTHARARFPSVVLPPAARGRM